MHTVTQTGQPSQYFRDSLEFPARIFLAAGNESSSLRIYLRFTPGIPLD